MKVSKEKLKIQTKKESSSISAQAQKILGISSQPTSHHDSEPYVALKYFQSDWQCLSEWQPEELSSFSKFLKKLAQHSWIQIPKSDGLGYKKYDVHKVKTESARKYLKKVRSQIAEDVHFFELRISGKIRVHGFRYGSAFFLVLLDRAHAVFPE